MKKHIPSVITMANLTCGFLAILIGDPLYSSLLILLGAFFDLFDGMAARKLNATSELGKQLDSLSDLVSFGVAPAFLFFQLSPSDHWINYIGPIAIVVGGAMRLGIFNIKEDTKYFEGLAIPSSGFFITGIILASHFDQNLIHSIFSNPIIFNLTGVFIFIMNLIPLKMFSVKTLGINQANKILMGLTILGGIILFILIPTIALSLVILWYIFLSILMNIFKWT